MKRELRYDRATLRKPKRTPQGFLRVDGHAARCGVLEYRNDDGTVRRELRLPEDVFAADALAGFEGAPLTDGHPNEPVTADNVRQYEIGNVTGPARRDGDLVEVSTMIKAKHVIDGVERGETGLSVGYAVDLEESPGEHPQYGRYDAIQRNIVINHLAVRVDPRAGTVARLRLDAVDTVAREEITEPEIDHRNNSTESAPMANAAIDELATMKVQLDEATKLATERKDALDAATAKLKTLGDDVAKLRASVAAGHAALETEAIKTHSERADAADKKLTELEARREADICAAAEVRIKAVSIMGEKFRVDGMNDSAIQDVVIKKLAPKEDLTSATPAYKKARFDSLVESYAAAAHSLVSASRTLTTGATQQTRLDSKEARAKAWRDQALNPKGYQATIRSDEEA